MIQRRSGLPDSTATGCCAHSPGPPGKWYHLPWRCRVHCRFEPRFAEAQVLLPIGARRNERPSRGCRSADSGKPLPVPLPAAVPIQPPRTIWHGPAPAEMCVVTGAGAEFRRCLVVLENREDAIEARFAGEMAIDAARGLLAVRHGGDDVRRAGHEIATRDTRSLCSSSGRSDQRRACRLTWWPGRTPRRIRGRRLRPPPG